MPHLKPSKSGTKTQTEQHRSPTTDDASETETDNGGNILLSLAASAPKEAPREAVTDPRTEAVSRTKVTPSPYTGGPPHGNEHHHYYGYETHPPSWMAGVTGRRGGKPMGVYGTGARRLFPSPIRCTRSKSDDDDVDESSSTNSGADTRTRAVYPFRGPPPHARLPFYGPPGAYSYPAYPPPPYGFNEQYSQHALAEHSPPSPVKRRQNPAPPSNASSPKRWKPSEDQDNLKLEEKDPNEADIEQGLQSPASTAGDDNASKQRVISPSSSIEGGLNSTGKSNDDECTSEANEKGTRTGTASEGVPQHGENGDHARYGSLEPRYGGPQGPYPPPYYPPGPGMYGYPHPYHYGEGSPPRGAWRMPPSGAYPPPQVHVAHPPYPSPYAPAYGHPTLPSYHPRYHLPESHAGNGSSQHRNGAEAKPPSAPQSSNAKRLGAGAVAPKIKSVAEWQRATLATGKAPSANRCMPLKAPIPSKYWGEAEKSKDFPIPDFHQLVNFPDYLNKMRPNGTEPIISATSNGKRPCVMCGKQRICSASSSGGNALRRSKKQGEEEEVDEDDTNHIIPRQNKGLCTACDISVWVFVESGLEIKWCKGCKNFRPWAAFGDKGLATKCVRCRDRQREKYAVQKDELRLRRMRQHRHEDEQEDFDAKEVSERQEIAAAKGLRDLMAASESI